ncbi:hypothetical protein M0802_015613 [Mischocyttarus mexicanus]|nr:hypothetical protein M0802_015613 [Mischocyttarus mexicanus]
MKSKTVRAIVVKISKGKEAEVQRSFKYGLVKVNKRIRNGNVKMKSQTVRAVSVKNNKRIRHGKSKIYQQKLDSFLVKILKGCVRVISAKSFGKVKTKQQAKRLSKNKSGTIRALLSANFKMFNQGYNSEKFRTRLIQDKSTKVGFFLGKTFKDCVRFLSAKSLGFLQRKIKVKSKQNERKVGQGLDKLIVWFSQG